MTFRLDVQFAANEGALLRILGLIERRGYSIRELDLSEQAAHSRLSILVEARDVNRRPDVVKRQIDNLYDVTAVTLTYPGMTVAA